MLLEVIAQSLEDARAAAEGGADRLEVVREIERDGLTPSLELVRAIASETGLPLRVMVRESEGLSVADPEEIGILRDAFAALAGLGVDGAIVGFARGGALDLETTAAVLASAPALRATFHRAFDAAADPFAAIDAVKELPQVDRILTSGGAGDWRTRCRRLERYAARAGRSPIVLVGGGVDEEAIRHLAGVRGVDEVHVGRAARELPYRGAPVVAHRVRRLKTVIESDDPHRANESA